MDIAVIGSNMVDLIAYINRMPEEGETVEAPDFTIGCGGKGANQAVAASRLGSDVLMVTRVGNDVFAANTIENFARNGIDTAHVLPTDATSGVAPIFVDPQAHNSIIIIKGANALLTPADVEAAEPDIAQCSLIVLQLEVPLDTVYAAIDLGKRHGIPVLLNPAPAHPDLELGARGAFWIAASQEKLIPAVEVAAVDTTGAGDAFIGCFSHYLVASGDVERALRLASHYAADSVTKLGTQTSLATKAEFEAAFPQLF